MLNFAKDIGIDLAIKGSVERVIKHFPQTIQGETRIIIVFDGFDSGQFAFIDPIY